MIAQRLLTPLKALFVLALLGVTGAQAQGYHVGVGDEVSIDHTGAEQPVLMVVDTDGQVRLSNVGGIGVAGMTLDQAEAKIAARMEETGFYISPNVSLTMVGYAPIVVGGDVIAPGRFDYVPAMTVASALALSGGGQVSGLTRTEIARARTDAQAGLRTSNLEIAIAVARLARLRAQLVGPDAAFSLDAEEESRIPSAALADMKLLLANEADVLANERDRTVQMLGFWADEIETVQAQRQNFDTRIELQLEIVQSTADNLEASRDLTERGLQTSAILSNAEQRDADARSRVLELEAAKIAAARAISLAKRERVVFLANQKTETLEGIQLAHQALEAAGYKYQRFQEQLALLTGGNAGSLVDVEGLALTFELQSLRADRPEGKDVTLDTLILPGETLIVKVSLSLDEMDG